MAGDAGPALEKHVVHWFRRGLRLHDNPALKESLLNATTFRCIFIVDPWFAGSSNVGINKWRFLLQCLEDLDLSLRKLNSRLFVIRGQPADALPKLFKEWGTTSLSFEEDPEPFGRVRDLNIVAMCREIGISVVSKVSHTLYKLERIIERNGGRAPLTYQHFQSIIAEMGAPELAESTLTADHVGPATTPVQHDHDDKYGVPTLEELGFDTEELRPPVWVGGEMEALARLERHLERKAWVASFGRPKMTPQSLLASQTGLSPYLRFGCLSTRLFYFQLTELYCKIKKARPPLSLHGQLLWREFFYTAATKNPNFDRMLGNPICVQIPWDKNNEALAKWASGQTGYPWIDAIMTQLREEGWIHHLARHAVACFLTRGDLWLSWEEGMKVFEELLLDADWSVNAGMWMWLSCSSFFQQFFHCYCPIKFGRKADPNGDYIKKYIPVLRSFPVRYIHCPWTAPEAVQEAVKCVVGRDYPLPMVDHAAASRNNLQRIKQVYRQLAKYTPPSDSDDITNSNALKLLAANNISQTSNNSSPSPTSIISAVNHSTYLCSSSQELKQPQGNTECQQNMNTQNNVYQNHQINDSQPSNQSQEILYEELEAQKQENSYQIPDKVAEECFVKREKNYQNQGQENNMYQHGESTKDEYGRNKKGDEYDGKNINDMFEEEKNNSLRQVRNLPFKKIVVVGQSYEKIQHTDLNLTIESYNRNVEVKYGVQAKPQSVDIGGTPFVGKMYQRGYMRNIMDGQSGHFSDTSRIVQWDTNSYKDIQNEFDTSDSDIFKHPSTDEMSGNEKKTHYNSKSGSMKTETEYDCRRKSESDSIEEYHQHRYSSKQNVISSTDHLNVSRTYEFKYNVRHNQTFIKSGSGRFDGMNLNFGHSSKQATAFGRVIIDSDSTANESEGMTVQSTSSNDQSMPECRGPGSSISNTVESGNDRSGLANHDCSDAEEKMRFQQGKTVIMQGCSRPEN